MKHNYPSRPKAKKIAPKLNQCCCDKKAVRPMFFGFGSTKNVKAANAASGKYGDLSDYMQ